MGTYEENSGRFPFLDYGRILSFRSSIAVGGLQDEEKW